MINYLDIFFIAIALAMDCFAVSIAMGVTQGFKEKPVFQMASFFGFFQALMPFIGFLAGFYFRDTIEYYSGWISLVILGLIGLNMIRQDWFSKNEPMAVNPNSLKGIMLLAVATSIDALATGVMFTNFSAQKLISTFFIIGIVSFVMSIFGCYLGYKFAKKISWHVNSLGGLLLISIGVKIFFEHL